MRIIKMKNIKLILAVCVFLCMSIMSTNTLNAAGLSVSVNKSSVYVGDKITFTVSVSGAAGQINVSGAANDSIWLDNSSKSYTVTASSAGSITLSASGTIAAYDNPVDKNVSGSKTVTVKNKPSSNSSNSNNSTNTSNNGSSSSSSSNSSSTSNNQNEEKKSSVNALSSLSVSEGSLSPEFKADTTQYTVNLGSDKTKLTVSAKAKDSKAKVSGTGEHNLKAGKNTITVKCTAEDGSVKNYTITVNVDETPSVYTTYNNKSLGVVKNLDGIEGPNKSFEKTTVTLDNQEVTAWKSEQLGKTVVYLQDENNNKGYYLYEDGKVTSRFEPVSFAGINMYIVDIPEDSQKISGMKFQELTIDEQTLPGWVFENKNLANYELIYAMQENGEMAYYLHEKTTNTFMLYAKEFLTLEDKIDQIEKENQKNALMRNIFIGTTGVFAVSTAVLAYLYFSYKKKSIAAIKDYYDTKNQG